MSFKKYNSLIRKTFKVNFFIAFFTIYFSAFTLSGQNKYNLIINLVDKDTFLSAGNFLSHFKNLDLQTSFNNKNGCADYIFKLPQLLTSKGYPSASVDSVYLDSANAYINLFLGQQYTWSDIKTDSIDKKILDQSGWYSKQFKNKKIDFEDMSARQKKILTYYEKTGYPFAEIRIDDIQIEEDKMKGRLQVKKGNLYHIDSIRVYGKVKIKKSFLQRYLGIYNGSVYNNEKLQNISKRILELPYLQEQQPANLSMLGTGATLNLYLKQKRSSQINFLVGFLPANTETGKAQLTGDVHLDLKNSLGFGESILLNWQQLQLKSPRLNIGYQHPYIFNSPFGIDFSFDLLKKDSSYLQINSQLGLQYILSVNQSGKIFLQNQRNYLLQGGYDTNQIKITKTLPVNIDVSSSSLGIDYEFINTNYRFNPRTGNEIKIITTAGIKKIGINNDIINLKDPANPNFNFHSLYDSLKTKAYQLRFNLIAARYFPVGKKSVLKTAVNTAAFSSENIFRNELFQIGGYRLLRGFDEESIYATQYAVFTEEYRYLVGLNSYVFQFVDIGITKTKYQQTNFTGNYIGAGLGLAFETKFGLLNLSYAIGKRSDVNFNIREASKIHFGYVNYF